MCAQVPRRGWGAWCRARGCSFPLHATLSSGLISQRLLLKTPAQGHTGAQQGAQERAVIGARCSPNSPASSGTGATHAGHLGAKVSLSPPPLQKLGSGVQ